MQSPAQKFQRISHTRNPSLSYQSLHFPSDRHFPLYAHCNSQRHRPTPRIRCNTQRTPRAHQKDLMRTIDHRYSGKSRRSSFALSDIFELDEEVEIEISPVLPSTPSSACSISTNNSAKSLMKSVLTDLAHTVKTKWGRARSRKMYIVEPAGRSARVDLRHL